jgi:L-aminopeptidase/D-esterase-like protein
VVSASANSLTIRGEGSNQTSVQQGLTKFWVKWNGTGAAAESDSFNSSGLTDNGTGDTTFGFTTNMGNANYSLATSNSSAEANNSQTNMNQPTTSTIRMDTRSGANDSNLDTSKNSGQINGDLA